MFSQCCWSFEWTVGLSFKKKLQKYFMAKVCCPHECMIVMSRAIQKYPSAFLEEQTASPIVTFVRTGGTFYEYFHTTRICLFDIVKEHILERQIVLHSKPGSDTPSCSMTLDALSWLYEYQFVICEILFLVRINDILHILEKCLVHKSPKW